MEAIFNKKQMKELFKTIAALKTADECKKFMRDLCTLTELKAMAERWQAAQQINQNIPYRMIAKKTGSSTATITRVAHWLHNGSGGYKLMLHRL
jgi:TrpR-related protein YerC/YecD